jgi:hypothetical protein
VTEPRQPSLLAPRLPKPPLAGRRGCLAAALLLLATAGALFWALRFGARLGFANRLAAPIRVSVNGGPARRVAPGESLALRLAPGRLLVAWELVRPVGPDGNPLGEEVRESVVLADARGSVRLAAGPVTAAGTFFAPLVTNAAEGPLRVRVNAGLVGARDCGCAVRPGARRAFVGYYRLYRNSTVEAQDAKRRRAVFRDLGDDVTAPDGTVGLRFESKDFRPAAAGDGEGRGG